MRAGGSKPLEFRIEVGLLFKGQAFQKIPPGDQFSAIRKADKPLLTLLGTL
jgi:hypothetical protein